MNHISIVALVLVLLSGSEAFSGSFFTRVARSMALKTPPVAPEIAAGIEMRLLGGKADLFSGNDAFEEIFRRMV